jgi:hypothetical protein
MSSNPARQSNVASAASCRREIVVSVRQDSNVTAALEGDGGESTKNEDERVIPVTIISFGAIIVLAPCSIQPTPLSAPQSQGDSH